MDRSALTIPNAISVVRLLLVPVFIWLVAIDQVGLAGLLLAVIGATDWVDGYLARRLDQVSEVGSFSILWPTGSLSRLPSSSA